MLGMFGNKKIEKMPGLFRVTLHIKRGANQEMPNNMVGAYVPVLLRGQITKQPQGVRFRKSHDAASSL